MMRLFYILLCIFTLHFLAKAQKHREKRDYVWLMGYGDLAPDFGTSIFDFNFSPPKIYRSDKAAKDDIGLANASICDKNGKLLYFTNGCHVEDSTFEILDGSLVLNPGNQEKFCERSNLGYSVVTSHLILPYPNDSTRFSIFHIGSDAKILPIWHSWQWLSYSEIDSKANAGKGAMTIKNQILANDSVFYGQLTACRHGNGRDWWIVSPKEKSNSLNICSLTPTGVSPIKKQKIGEILPIESVGGQADFTPDGTRYVRYDAYNGIRIYDFDRCTGTFSNYRRIPSFSKDYQEGGNAISQNSRFLYVTKSLELWQFDLLASDIGASRVLIANWDTTFVTPNIFYFQAFFNCRLAPDNKIYICGTGTSRYWNVIHQPNEKGIACDFRQHDILLPTWSFASMPNFPYFRLYDKPGSVCDTLGINDPLSIEEKEKIIPHRIYPNPTTSILTVAFDEQSYEKIKVLIFNNLGQLILQENIKSPLHQIDIFTLPNATYFYQLRADEKVLARGKFVKME